MRRGRIEPPSARPVALRLSAFSSRLRAALLRLSGSGPARLDASSARNALRSALSRASDGPEKWFALPGPMPASSRLGLQDLSLRASQRAPRAGAVVPPERCPEASRDWFVTPAAGAALTPPLAYLRMAAPRG